jgi:hypothetical protein
MQHQLSEMGEQTKVLKDSVAHAGTSAESALRSVKLQEAQLRQWLDIEEVNLQSTPIQGNTVEATLTISFQINNPTKMVLALKEITTNLFDEGPESCALEYTLAPDHGYPFQMDIIISGQSFRKYMKDVFVIPVSGLIGFDDAFGERQHYGFGFACHCRYPNWFQLRTYEGKIPQKESGDKPT